VDQGWTNYTPAQHAVWKTLYERQTQLLPGLACDAFVDGMNKLPMSADCIPNFEALSETCTKHRLASRGGAWACARRRVL
jgi:phenylalanine-4-hydroxylase